MRVCFCFSTPEETEAEATELIDRALDGIAAVDGILAGSVRGAAQRPREGHRGALGVCSALPPQGLWQRSSP